MSEVNDHSIEPQIRMRCLSNYSSQVEIDAKIPLKRYYFAGKEMLRMMKVYLAENDYINAYQLQVKFLTLFLEKIERHPQYKTYPAKDKQAGYEPIEVIMKETETTREKLLQIFQRQYEKAQKMETLDDAANVDNCLDMNADSDGKRSSVDVPLVVEMPISVKDVEYPDMNDDSNDESKADNKIDVATKTKKRAKTATNGDDGPVAGPSTANGSGGDGVLQAKDDLPISSRLRPRPEIDRSTRPRNTRSSTAAVATAVATPASSSANVAFGVDGNKRKMYIPPKLYERFLQHCKPNTSHNVETCGILGGYLNDNVFYITHIIIPKQTGTSDWCSATNEEELYAYQEANDVCTLGWIHSHPTQSAFMSSVDLHTHLSYQGLLDESIAVVCAPRDKCCSFSITRNGLAVLRGCSLDGFHSHNSNDLYMESPHVHVDRNLNLVIKDLR